MPTPFSTSLAFCLLSGWVPGVAGRRLRMAPLPDVGDDDDENMGGEVDWLQ